MLAAPIAFYFDFSSPYSYIASEWVEALAARHGRTVEWHAMLLGATFQVTDILASHWARHCLRAYFARGVDLSDLASLRALAQEFGLDADQAEAVWNDAQWKLRLKAENDAAIALGVFGTPYFVIDGEPFWGNDRRAQIERWLEKGPF